MELLINIAAHEHPLAYQPGDVIVACPDGWPWSAAERTHPEWRIVSVNLPATSGVALMMPKHDLRQVVRKRAQRLNLAKLPALNASASRERQPDEIIALTIGEAHAATEHA